MQPTQDFDQIVTTEQLRTVRTYRDWRAWTESALSQLRSTPESRSFLRFAKGPVKRLKEEVLPTVRLVERLLPEDQVWIAFPCDSGPADALLSLSSSMKSPIPVQVTCDFSHEEQLRLELLHQQGYAPGSGPVSRRAGRIYAEHDVYSLDEAVERVLTPLRARIAAKRKTRHAPETWLLIHFRDEVLPPEGVDPVMDACAQLLEGSPFQAAFIVGNTEENRLCRLLNGSIPQYFRFLSSASRPSTRQ
jgi:hypothetical protein